MLLWMVLLLCVSMTEAQELFQDPVLSRLNSSETSDLLLKCTAKVDPNKPASELFYSFYKDNHIIQNRSHNPLFFISDANEENSGLYQCVVDAKDGTIQKKSDYLDIDLCTSVSQPVLTLQHEAINLAEGDKVKFLCETQLGSLPILYSFYMDGEILGEPLAPSGRAASLLISVKAEWSGKNYSCQAENKVSRDISEPKKFPLVVSGTASMKSTTMVIWLPVSCLVGWPWLLRF